MRSPLCWREKRTGASKQNRGDDDDSDGLSGPLTPHLLDCQQCRRLARPGFDWHTGTPRIERHLGMVIVRALSVALGALVVAAVLVSALETVVLPRVGFTLGLPGSCSP